MIKYTGHVIGIRPNSATSLYNIVTSDSAIIWRASVVATANEYSFQIAYNYEGDGYDIQLKKVREDYYTGKLVHAHKDYGECFLYVYTKNNDLLLKGDYKDDWSGQWEVLIELKEVKLR